MLQKDQINAYGLDDWVTEFNEIYGGVNERRSIDSIWLHAVEHASMLHESLRIGEYENALSHIADIFCWLCALTTKAHSELKTKESLLDIVLCKYPRICFYCGYKKCSCSVKLGRGLEIPINKQKLIKKALQRAQKKRTRLHSQGNEPKSLQEVEEMFRQIYDHINFRTPLEIIMAHLQEEVGEVASCLNNFTDKQEIIISDQHQSELEREIADVMTWLIALTLKLDYMLVGGAIYLIRTIQIPNSTNTLTKYLKTRSLGITLSDILWTQFQVPDGDTLWCPSCKERPCKLKLLSRGTTYRLNAALRDDGDIG
jgi:NTP pyrophosphatase (non-canonical NTP hydrolase)